MPLTDEDIVRDLLHRGTPQLILPASMVTGVAPGSAAGTAVAGS